MAETGRFYGVAIGLGVTPHNKTETCAVPRLRAGSCVSAARQADCARGD